MNIVNVVKVEVRSQYFIVLDAIMVVDEAVCFKDVETAK